MCWNATHQSDVSVQLLLLQCSLHIGNGVCVCDDIGRLHTFHRHQTAVECKNTCALSLFIRSSDAPVVCVFVQLLANILSWHGILGDELLRRLALDGLLNRYIVLGLANSHVDHLAMEKCRAVRF